ncbi:ionotropic receptor 75a-like [Cochliomyia hominivorax]
MINFSLVNLILYNFLENNIKWAIILHCWDVKTQLHLADQAMNQNVYIQFWSINNIDLTTPLEGHYLVKDRPLLGIYFDMNCSNSLEVLQKSSEEKLFKQHFHWLIYDSLGDLPKFKDLFGRFQMAVDADVTLFMDNRNLINSPLNSSFILYDVYNNGYNLGGKLNMTIDREIKCSKRSCEVKRYLSSLHEKPKLEHRWYLRDITMRVSTVVTYLPLTDPPEKLLAYLSSTKDKYLDGVAKFGFQYLMILKENLECEFSYNFTNLWSGTEVTGGCIGAIGIEGTADLSSSPFLSSKNRLKYVEAMMILGNFRQVCIFRTPLNSGIQGAVFFEPFSARVWILFGVVLILAAVLLWLTFFVEFHQMKAMLGFVPSILTTCLIAFGSACYQGSFLIPSSTGGRTVFITLSLLTFIMYNYYTSIVVSILLGSPVESNIKTMGQLADSNLEVGIVPLPYTKTFLNISPRADIRRFVRNKIESKRNADKVWMSVDVGLHRVRVEPGFVFVLESFSGYDLIKKTYTEQEICDLNEVLLRPEQPLYQHLPKNSSYKKIIKLKQVRIMESGIYSRHNRLFGKGRLTCYLSSNSLVQVGLEYTAPLFIMLATAYIVVLLLMFMELMWQKFERKLRMSPEKENVEERKEKIRM